MKEVCFLSEFLFFHLQGIPQAPLLMGTGEF